MNQPGQKLWTRHFVIICLSNLLCFLSFHMLVASFPFFVKHLGGGDALAGAVAGMFSIASLLIRPVVGWTLDNISRRLPLMLGAAGLVVLAALYAQLAWLPLIVALRFLHGIAWAGASTGNNTNACDHVPQTRFAEGMGYFSLTTTLSMACAPALGLFLKDSFGFSHLFLTSSAIAFCAFVLSFFISYRPLPAEGRVPFRQSFKNLLEKSALPASVTVFFFIVPYGAVNTFIALYAVASGRGSGGLYFTIVAMIAAVMRVAGGRLADRYGERPIVYGGSASLALSLLFLSVFSGQATFLLSALTFGLGFGAMPPAMQAMAMRIAEPKRRGAASSTYLCAFDLGIGLGGISSGVLVKYLGHTAMFACMLAPLACCLLVYALWAGKSPAAFKGRRLEDRN